MYDIFLKNECLKLGQMWSNQSLYGIIIKHGNCFKAFYLLIMCNTCVCLKFKY